MEVLGPDKSEKYLGRKLCLSTYHATEVRNQIALAWGSFMKFKKELCGKHYPLHDRIRLFEAVVTPRALYGAAAWTLTESLERALRTARRRMLRMVSKGSANQ